MRPNTRNPYFDLSRAFCLLNVCAHHFFTYINEQQVSNILSVASYSLPFFFVLSGYLVHELLVDKHLTVRQLRHFYLNRSLRIFPSYFFIFIVASFFLTLPYKFWFVTYLLNIKIFMVSLNPSELSVYLADWYNNGIHYWSMGVEEQFYLLYPLCLLMFRNTNRILVLSGLIILSFSLHLLITLLYPQAFSGALLPVAGQYILWGALFAELKAQHYLERFKGHTALALIILVTLLWSLGLSAHHAFIQFKPTLYLSIFAIVMAYLVYSLDRLPRYSWTDLTVVRVVAHIGRASYGIYLIHLFWLDWFYQSLPALLKGSGTISFLLFFAFVVLQGLILWHFVDAPIYAWRKGIRA